MSGTSGRGSSMALVWKVWGGGGEVDGLDMDRGRCRSE